MLLLVDAGNSRVKWALAATDNPQAGVAGRRWSASGAVDSAKVLQLADAWRGHSITHAILSNVAGQTMRDGLQDALLRALGPKPVPMEWFVSVPLLCGVRNAYRDPHQLGSDRFASAIGAHALFGGQALIIATCGTATTIDALSPDGVFLGGMILPGLGLMAASLARNTAQLPQVAQQAAQAVTPSQPFADNTDAAIVSGCLAAQAGAIERACAAHAQTYGAAHCVLSGGAADMIAPHLSFAHTRVDNLVLVGLQTVAMRH